MNTDIKKWQERCDWLSDRPAPALIVEAMKAEIADLRAALAAALAAGQIASNTAATRIDASFVPLVEQAPSAPQKKGG